MKNILIVGAGGHSRVVISILQEMGNLNVVGIFDPRFSGEEENILGCSVFMIFVLYTSSSNNFSPGLSPVIFINNSLNLRF